MALAQELFSPAAVGYEEPAHAGPSRRPRTGRAKRGKGTEPEGKLAQTVAELRSLEDGIVSRLAAAERLVGGLVSRRVHEDAGYGSRNEFEERMLAGAPLLRAMREAQPASPLALRPSVPKRESGDVRARGLKALTTVARALDRIRAFDEELGGLAATARARLGAVETLRLFEECGYASFEEFLERALGPSPMLSIAVSLVASAAFAPGPETATGEDRSSGPSPVARFDRAAQAASGDGFKVQSDDLLGDAALSAPAFEAAAEDDTRGDLPAPAPAAAGAKPPRALVRTVLVCLVAALFGGFIGAWTEIAAPARQSTAPQAPVCVAARESAGAATDRSEKVQAPRSPADVSHAKAPSAPTLPGVRVLLPTNH